MKKKKILIAVGVVAVLATGGASAYWLGSQSESEQASTSTTSNTTMPQGGPGGDMNAVDGSTDTDAKAGEVITDLTAPARGHGFDGTLDSEDDLDALLATACGDGGLDLHRGHQPIENILTVFLGIDHAQLHVYMEEQNMSLAAVAEELGYDPENLIDSLTNSFEEYVQQGIDNGVLTESEAEEFRKDIREQFSNRVNWDGNE
jgi:hypothetical protein